MPRMIVFCATCARQNNWKRPVARTSTKACDLCGSWDAIRKRKRNPRTGEVTVEVVKLNNFEHRADMLPGTPEEAQLQKAFE